MPIIPPKDTPMDIARKAGQIFGYSPSSKGVQKPIATLAKKVNLIAPQSLQPPNSPQHQKPLSSHTATPTTVGELTAQEVDEIKGKLGTRLKEWVTESKQLADAIVNYKPGRKKRADEWFFEWRPGVEKLSTPILRWNERKGENRDLKETKER